LTYNYKISCINSFGEGAQSSAVGILAASAPDQLAAPSTAASGTNVIISWAATPNERGSSVTSYRITIQKSDSSYVESASCIGTGSVFNNRQCTVPMSTFTSSPYSLAEGTLILVKVEALNGIDYSPISSANVAGVLAKNSPSATVTITVASASSTEIDFNWNDLTANSDTGYSAITNYKIYYLEGFGGGSFTFIGSTGTLTSFTHSTANTPSYPVTDGQYYSYKVEAENIFGAGPKSTATSPTLASDTPQSPTPPTSTYSSNNVLISWTPTSTF
jgi:hypothetical protein